MSCTKARLGRTIVALTGCVLLLAAGTKLWDLAAFASAVRVWNIFPSALLGPVTAGLPALELLLGIGCIVTRSRLAAIAACTLFLTLQIGWLVLYFSGKAPECSCFGVLDKWVRERAGLTYDMFKSGALAILSLAGAILTPSTPSMPSTPSPSASSDISIEARRSPGFTIIEMMVCLTVLALFMAILVPTLSGLRERARSSKSLSHLRQHGVAMTGYTSDFKGYLPAIGTPQDPSMTLSATGERIDVPIFLIGAAYWNYPLLEAGYYPGKGPNDEVFFDAGKHARIAESIRLGSPAGANSFMQSCSTLAQPEYWNPLTRTGSQQWGATRLADVTLPSRKAMLLNITPFYDRVPSPEGVWPTQWPPSLRFVWLLADGASESTIIDDVRPGMFTGDGPPPVLHPADMMPGLHTFDGIRGHDK